MNYINKQEIVDIFKKLNDIELEYILIRNIHNELPSFLEVGKDIDILLDKKTEKDFKSFFHENNYEIINHPFKNEVFLYGVDKFEFYHNKNNNILFDLNFQIACRSLDAGQWIPLDRIIQESAWENRRFEQLNDEFGYWTLSYEDEFITLIARSIFDKREFQSGYVSRIDKLYQLINLDAVTKKLNMVFFKFTPFLLKLIENKEYEGIISNYLEFKEY